MSQREPAAGGMFEDEWEEWYRMTPLERWRESQKLWEFYRLMGWALDAEPDSQSPFDAELARCSPPADRRTSLRVLRRSGV